MTAQELLPMIKASGTGDRLSENLYKWVKKWQRSRSTFPLEAVFLHWNNLDGSYVEKAEGKTQTQQILIGHSSDEDWFSGARLSSILGGTNAEVYAFPPKFETSPLPNWFQDYIAGGKCFIDPEHRLYHEKERWQLSENGSTRVCRWCGVAQQKRVVPRVVEDIYWDTLSA